MKDYRHMMEQVTLSDQKKEEIMDMLENKDTRKRRMPKAGKLILAAALAVGCALSIAAGLPAQVYNFVSGGSATINPGTGEGVFNYDVEENNPITVENGRLWFDADGQKVDVTDKMDANTPYIYERTDPKTGNKGYVVVGGTIEDFGWVEITQVGDTYAMGGDNYDTLSLAELYEMQEAQKDAHGGEFKMIDTGSHRPWFQAALDQLGLDL